MATRTIAALHPDRAMWLAALFLLAACSSPQALESGAGDRPTPDEEQPAPTSTSPTTSEFALVVIADAIDVRTGPGTHHPISEARFVDNGIPGSMPVQLRRDELIWVVDTPVSVAGQAWFHVAVINRPYDDGRFLTGWIAGGDGSDVPVARFDDPSRCPAPEVRAVEDAIGGIRRLACFGAEPFSVIGKIQSGEPPCDGHWLTCPAGHLEGDVIGDQLPLYLDPASSIELPASGAYAQVVGRLEHPEAAGCAIGAADAEQAIADVLYCRSRVVVESVTSPPPPSGQLGEPAPVLELLATEPTEGGGWIRYAITVVNAGEFPDELFSPAPGLPPCGASPHSARAWVEIFEESGAPIATFCALTEAEGLRELYFMRLTGVPPPAVYIEIQDRVTEEVYRSNTVRFDDS